MHPYKTLLFSFCFDCRSLGGTTCFHSWRCQQCCSYVCCLSYLRVLATCWLKKGMRLEQKEVLQICNLNPTSRSHLFFPQKELLVLPNVFYFQLSQCGIWVCLFLLIFRFHILANNTNPSVIFDSNSPHTVSLLYFSPFVSTSELWGGFCLIWVMVKACDS